MVLKEAWYNFKYNLAKKRAITEEEYDRANEHVTSGRGRQRQWVRQGRINQPIRKRKTKSGLGEARDWIFERGEAATRNLPNFDDKMGFFGNGIDLSGVEPKSRKKKRKSSNTPININLNLGSTKRRKKKRKQ